MNPYIPKLLRARYAMNMIISLKNTYGVRSKEYNNSVKDFQKELDLPLYEEKNGKRIAVNGTYVGQIFVDIFARTGISCDDLNLRKRIMGIREGFEIYTPSHLYRKAILKYLGMESWKELETDAEILYNRLKLDIDNCECPSSLFGFIPVRYTIKPHNMNEGDTINLYMSERTMLSLKCQGECKFKVKDVSGLSLIKNDVLTITAPFVHKNRLYAEKRFNNERDKGEYLSEHTILDYKLIKGEISKQLDKEAIDAVLAKAAERKKIREKNECQ